MIWYIIGVLFVLLLYPLDIAVVSILMYVSLFPAPDCTNRMRSLSWADTNASTFGRLWGRYTPALPKHLFGLPLAPRKSLAGFLAAAITGGLTAVLFWSYLAPMAMNPEITWTWDQGVVGYGRSAAGGVVGEAVKAGMQKLGLESVHTGGIVGISVIGVVAGLVSGVAEALGTLYSPHRMNANS